MAPKGFIIRLLFVVTGEKDITGKCKDRDMLILYLDKKLSETFIYKSLKLHSIIILIKTKLNT